MRICDISLEQIRLGLVWRVACDPDEIDSDLPLEELGPLQPCDVADDEDRVVYSGLIAFPDGSARAIVLLREVGSYEYGGDYCELVHGHWRQLGLSPDPSVPIGEEFVASPLPNDRSFEASSHDERERQRLGFRQHVAALR